MALLGEHAESEGRRQEGDKHYFLRQRPDSEESFVYEAELPVTIPEPDPRVVEDHAGMMRIPVSGSSMTLSACDHARDRILCNLS